MDYMMGYNLVQHLDIVMDHLLALELVLVLVPALDRYLVDMMVMV